MPFSTQAVMSRARKARLSIDGAASRLLKPYPTQRHAEEAKGCEPYPTLTTHRIVAATGCS